MLDAAATFAASLNYTDPYWLSLIGHSGCGKTHLAKAIWRQFMEQNRFELKFDPIRNRTYGNTGGFYSWRNVCSALRDGSFGLLEDICDEWFVVLDDIGSERDPNGFIASALDRVFNERLGKWTVITTNLSLAEIADRIDVRIASRMLRDKSVVIESKADDYSLRPTPK